MNGLGVAVGKQTIQVAIGELVRKEIVLHQCITQQRRQEEYIFDCYELAKKMNIVNYPTGILIDAPSKRVLLQVPFMTQAEANSFIRMEGKDYIQWEGADFVVEHMRRESYTYGKNDDMALYMVALERKTIIESEKCIRILGGVPHVIDYWEAGAFNAFKERRDVSIVSVYKDVASLRLWDEQLLVAEATLPAIPARVADVLEKWDEMVRVVNGTGLVGVKILWDSTYHTVEEGTIEEWVAIEDHFGTIEPVPIKFPTTALEEQWMQDVTCVNAIGALVRVLTKGKPL